MHTHTSYTRKSVTDCRKPTRKFLLITEVMISDQNPFTSKSGLIYAQPRPSAARHCAAIKSVLYWEEGCFPLSCYKLFNSQQCLLEMLCLAHTSQHFHMQTCDLRQAILKGLERQKYSVKDIAHIEPKDSSCPCNFEHLSDNRMNSTGKNIYFSHE